MSIIDFLKIFEVHSILLIGLLTIVRQYAAPIDMSSLVAVDFEVHGKVQGVFFRKYTDAKARELKLNGWCMNTEEGTVLGYIEGNHNNIEEMKEWLRRTGSPQSRIDKVDFRNQKELNAPTLNKFTIRK